MSFIEWAINLSREAGDEISIPTDFLPVIYMKDILIHAALSDTTIAEKTYPKGLTVQCRLCIFWVGGAGLRVSEWG